MWKRLHHSISVYSSTQVALKLHIQTQILRITILRILLWSHLAPNTSSNCSKCLKVFSEHRLIGSNPQGKLKKNKDFQAPCHIKTKNKDQALKDKDKDLKLVLKESLGTRTRTRTKSLIKTYNDYNASIKLVSLIKAIRPISLTLVLLKKSFNVLPEWYCWRRWLNCGHSMRMWFTVSEV